MSRGAPDSELSQLSLDYLRSRPKSERSPIGQFLTPRSIRQDLIAVMDLKPGMKVLDPGVGTGEFLKSCHESQDGLELEGWDIDSQALEVAKKLVPEAKLKCQSALEQDWLENFDVVIGNPPYFEIRNLPTELHSKFKQVIGGRPNIFSLFFAVGLGMLKPGGTLGYVVPPSMNNGAFFSKLRTFINERASIEYLKVYEDSKIFLDAQTAVQLIVLKKGSKSTKHVVDLGQAASSTQSRTIFTENASTILNEFVGRTTLWHLGYEAVTGSLVWNQHKEELRRTEQAGTVPLIWAHNISEELEIVLDSNHPKKPQFISSENYWLGPAVVVNRITGSVGQGSLRCALIPEDFPFLAENHINVIRARQGITQKISISQLIKLLRQPEVNLRIQKLTGNTQLSCVELTHFLPVDYDLEVSQSLTLF